MGRFRLIDEPTDRRGIRAYVISAVSIALLVYVGFGAFLYSAQRAMIFMPVVENPSRNVPHERITVNGVSLKVWAVNPGASRAVIYFGGNAEDVHHNADEFGRYLPDMTTYLVNYRGYGGSEGEPSEQALFADARALFDHLVPRHASVDVIGRSLGSGVATYLASQREVRHLVLVTPFDDIAAVAQRMYPVYPIELLLKDRFESVRYAPQVTAPVQLLIAERDTMVPPVHAQRLADAFGHEAVVEVTIGGAGHNDITRYGPYWQALAGFLSDPAAFAGD